MYHPTTRVLTVLELLQTHGRLPSATLAKRLEVDKRTVRRYITMLQDLGIPIEGERGRHGGYRLRPGYKLPPLMLTDDEALAVTLGLLAARQLGLAAAAPAVEGALAKLARVLPEAVRAQVAAVQEAVVFDVPAVTAAPASAIVSAFSTAISRGQRLHITYQSERGRTERVIDPYGLVYRQGAWYAAGWCHLRAARRLFRLDRVQQALVLDEPFERPAGFDSRQYVQQALAALPGAWTAEVLLETTLAEAQRWISPVLGTLHEAPGGVVLRCQADSLARLAYYLARLPWPLVVRQPPELVTALRDLAARLTRTADASTAPAGSQPAHAESSRRGEERPT